jgi:oligoribonuclease
MLLAGSSIGQDKIFLQKDLPELFDLLHYRVLDVSSLKELGARWATLPERPRYVSDHRARSDILSSIEGTFFSIHCFVTWILPPRLHLKYLPLLN